MKIEIIKRREEGEKYVSMQKVNETLALEAALEVKRARNGRVSWRLAPNIKMAAAMRMVVLEGPASPLQHSSLKWLICRKREGDEANRYVVS